MTLITYNCIKQMSFVGLRHVVSSPFWKFYIQIPKHQVYGSAIKVGSLYSTFLSVLLLAL